jgi:TRAP-type C4-dicarboxylate transport system substrate-binding protein
MSAFEIQQAARTALLHSFISAGTRCGAVALALLWSFAATAEPIQLKLAFFPPEDTAVYDSAVKPFVDAVNSEGKGVLAIEVYANGKLGKAVAEQPGLVLDGVADIAWVVPGQTPYRFPDNELLELPGRFRDAREGTLVYTRLIAANALRGYKDFFVIGAFTSAPTLIHSRMPIDSLASLKGQKIRANNAMEAEALERFGATPTVLPASQLAAAVGRGAIDGAAMSPTALFDFNVAPVAKNHYLLYGGAAPLVMVMNRNKFDGLPEAAKALIRKYSGERAAAAWIASWGGGEREYLVRIKSDPERKVVEPSASDLEAAQRTYQALSEVWGNKSARSRALLAMIEAELATIRKNMR